MVNKTFIIYDLKDKTNAERTAILRKLYDYRDKSNYEYTYERKGIIKKDKIKRTRKTVLEIENKQDLAKIIETLNKLNIKFDLAKT